MSKLYHISFFIVIFIVILILSIRFLYSDNYNNIILMTGLPMNTNRFFSSINGKWLLIPKKYDYNNVSLYRHNKSLVSYYYIGLISLSSLSTVLGLSRITYYSDNPNNSQIDINHFSSIKKYLGLSKRYQLVRKFIAIFRLINLKLTGFIIKDGEEVHLIETYQYLCLDKLKDRFKIR